MSENGEENAQPEEPVEEEAPDLDISVGVENGKVFIQFSQRLSIVAMPVESARTMAEALIAHADEAEKMGS